MEITENETDTKRSDDNDLKGAFFLVTVHADRGWQNTGLGIEKDEILRMDYHGGQWKGDVGFTSCPYHGPAGPTCDAYTAPGGYPLPGVVEDCLVGKIGSDVFFVGEQLRKKSKGSGTIHLTINDTGHHDNKGSITMKVWIGKP